MPVAIGATARRNARKQVRHSDAETRIVVENFPLPAKSFLSVMGHRRALPRVLSDPANADGHGRSLSEVVDYVGAGTVSVQRIAGRCVHDRGAVCACGALTDCRQQRVPLSPLPTGVEECSRSNVTPSPVHRASRFGGSSPSTQSKASTADSDVPRRPMPAQEAIPHTDCPAGVAGRWRVRTPIGEDLAEPGLREDWKEIDVLAIRVRLRLGSNYPVGTAKWVAATHIITTEVTTLCPSVASVAVYQLPEIWCARMADTSRAVLPTAVGSAGDRSGTQPPALLVCR